MAKPTGGSPYAIQNIMRNKQETMGRAADMLSTVHENHSEAGQSTTVRNVKVAPPSSYAPRAGMKKKMYGKPFGEQEVNK